MVRPVVSQANQCPARRGSQTFINRTRNKIR